MTFKIKIKNAEEFVLLDPNVYEYFNNHPRYSEIKLLENIRKHSSGCAVFQKTWKKAGGGFKTETIYLHKLIAEIFLADNDAKGGKENNLVGTRNGNKLDCRLENILWRSRSWASRQRKTTSRTGYMGVYAEGKRFRAVISYKKRSIHIGMFDSAEEAAEAYNKKSQDYFGDRGKQNKIKSQKN